MHRRSELVAYFLWAFAVAWGGVALVALGTGLPARPGTPDTARLWVFGAMLAGPAAAALGLTVLVEGRSGLRALWARVAEGSVPGRWSALLLLAPGALALALAALAITSPAYAPAVLTAPAPGAIVAFALVAGLGAGVFEELGWTGYATPRLLAGGASWLRAGLALGVPWAAWHVLADRWGGAAYGALWGPHMLEWLVALPAFRVLMTWAYARTGSLPLAMLLHASFTGGQALLWPRTEVRQELLWYGIFALVLWLAVATVWALEHGRAHGARRAGAS